MDISFIALKSHITLLTFIYNSLATRIAHDSLMLCPEGHQGLHLGSFLITPLHNCLYKMLLVNDWLVRLDSQELASLGKSYCIVSMSKLFNGLQLFANCGDLIIDRAEISRCKILSFSSESNAMNKNPYCQLPLLYQSF